MTRASQHVTPEMMNLLLREGEGFTLEFKESYTPRIDADISAFANGRGGTLLLGVRDDGSVAGESRVKNAGILFFAKDPHDLLHQAQMTLLAFKGTDRLHIYDRRDVRDDLLTQFNEAVDFLMKHLNVRSEIRGLDREDIYEIPLEVLREALVNALMHRDYSIAGTQISVEVHDDRVEIVNPGGLPKGLSIRDLGTVSIRRNELIADLFFRLHKVERIGQGIRKMKEAMTAAGLSEPTFAADAFFRATFHRSPEYARKNGGIGERFGKKFGTGSEKSSEKSSEKILKILRERNTASAKEIANTLGLTPRAVEKHIASLKAAGRLRRVGPAKGGRWEVIY